MTEEAPTKIYIPHSFRSQIQAEENAPVRIYTPAN